MQIEILAGTPAGGGQDRAARALAAALSGNTSVVNIPGRGGSNAWDELARRAGDQGTVAISSPTLILNTALGVAEIDDRDLTPIAQLCTEYLAFAVTVDAPWTTPADLAHALATGRVPVSLAVARGNVNHIALGAILSEAGARPNVVEPRVFDSARDAVADLSAGHAGVAVVSAASVAPELASGALRAVAVTAPDRLATPFDQVPTWRESGFQTTIGTWRGVVAPPGITADDLARLSEAVAQAVQTAEWHSAVERHLWVPTDLGPDESRQFLANERRLLTEALAGLALR